MNKKKIILLSLVVLVTLIAIVTRFKHQQVIDTFLIDTDLYDDWDKLVLVNASNPLDSEDIPNNLVDLSKLVAVNDNRQYLIDIEVAEHLVELLKDFQEANKWPIDIRVTSAYRSYEYQKNLYDSYDEHERQGLVATPGCSEHQTGLAVDIAQSGIKASQLEHTKFYEYLKYHAHEHGFIIRYPKDKQWQTGVKFEPWHLRYIGKEHADKVFNSGLTFEEYWKIIFNKIYTV